jgi:mono/diheme cytochrome c family protein
MFKLVTLITLFLLLTGCTASLPAYGTVTSDAERGAQLFAQGQNAAPPCSGCHQIVAGQSGFSLGPNLANIGEHAEMRIDGVTAEEYLHQSILEPGHYIVSGYRDIMYPDYSAHFTRADIQDLIAYLLTL